MKSFGSFDRQFHDRWADFAQDMSKWFEQMQQPEAQLERYNDSMDAAVHHAVLLARDRFPNSQTNSLPVKLKARQVIGCIVLACIHALPACPCSKDVSESALSRVASLARYTGAM